MAKRLKRYPVRGLVDELNIEAEEDELNFEGVYFADRTGNYDVELREYLNNCCRKEDGTEDIDLREYLNYCIRKEAEAKIESEAKIEAEELGRRNAWLNWAGGWAVQAQARGAT